MSSRFIVNFLNCVPQLNVKASPSQDADYDGLALTGTLLSTRKLNVFSNDPWKLDHCHF